jgi:hypothetical protein
MNIPETLNTLLFDFTGRGNPGRRFSKHIGPFPTPKFFLSYRTGQATSYYMYVLESGLYTVDSAM